MHTRTRSDPRCQEHRHRRADMQSMTHARASPTSNTMSRNKYVTSGKDTAQIVDVPHFKKAELSKAHFVAKAWDGKRHGVIVFRCKVMIVACAAHAVVNTHARRSGVHRAAATVSTTVPSPHVHGEAPQFHMATASQGTRATRKHCVGLNRCHGVARACAHCSLAAVALHTRRACT